MHHPRLTGDVESGPSGPLPTKLDFLPILDNRIDLDEISILGTPSTQLATRVFIEDDSESVDTTYSMIVSCGIQMTLLALIFLIVPQIPRR